MRVSKKRHHQNTDADNQYQADDICYSQPILVWAQIVIGDRVADEHFHLRRDLKDLKLGGC
jgi:hypothetical protein